MAIKFKHFKSGEIRVAETEPMISAMFNSSDRGPNAQFGQDLGWRLAPEVVVQLRRMRQDPQVLQAIALRTSRPMEDIDDKAILKYISDMTDVENAPVAQDGDYEEMYEQEIRILEESTKEQEAEATPDKTEKPRVEKTEKA